jgi:hypothetical protein
MSGIPPDPSQSPPKTCAAPDANPAPRSSPVARVHRLQRIFGRLEEGATYAAIGAEERISGERVRQIVDSALKKGTDRIGPEHWQMQMARLMPALRLARAALAKGETSAIRPFLSVLDRLDNYRKSQSDYGSTLIVPEKVEKGAQERLARLDGLGAAEEYAAKIAQEPNDDWLYAPYADAEEIEIGENSA